MPNNWAICISVWWHFKSFVWIINTILIICITILILFLFPWMVAAFSNFWNDLEKYMCWLLGPLLQTSFIVNFVIVDQSQCYCLKEQSKWKKGSCRRISCIWTSPAENYLLFGWLLQENSLAMPLIATLAFNVVFLSL